MVLIMKHARNLQVNIYKHSQLCRLMSNPDIKKRKRSYNYKINQKKITKNYINEHRPILIKFTDYNRASSTGIINFASVFCTLKWSIKCDQYRTKEEQSSRWSHVIFPAIHLLIGKFVFFQ